MLNRMTRHIAAQIIIEMATKDLVRRFDRSVTRTATEARDLLVKKDPFCTNAQTRETIYKVVQFFHPQPLEGDFYEAIEAVMFPIVPDGLTQQAA